MGLRANWKGFLKIAELSCAVALYSATSRADRIVLHTVNRKTGHRVERVFLDSETGARVDRADQLKGYEVANNDYVSFEPDEVSAVLPVSDKTIAVMSFAPCAEVDAICFDKPYYLGPADAQAEETLGLIRDGLEKKKVAAIGQAVLFRRARTLLLRPCGKGLLATTLHFDYEVRSAEEVFADIPDIHIKGEMLKLAEHIIETKRGAFDPSTFEDRYEAALADLVKAKIEGKSVKAPAAPKATKVVNLLDALRASAGATNARGKSSRKKPAPKRAPPRRKAG